MTTLAGWNPNYFMTASGATTATIDIDFDDSTWKGPSGDSDFPAVFLTNRPEFNPNQEVITSDKATSFPFPVQGDNDVERTLGTQAPEATYEFDLDVRSLYIPLVTLLQPDKSAIQGNTGVVKTIQAYTSGVNTATVDKFANLFRYMDGANNQKIVGAVANSIGISGSEGEIVSCSVDFVGSSYDTTNNSFSGTWTKSDSFKMVAFDDLYVAMGSGTSTSEIDVTSIDLTVENNLVSKFYNNKTIQRYILGNLDVSLSLSLPWSDSNVSASNLANWLGVSDDEDDPVKVIIANYTPFQGDSENPGNRGEFKITMYGGIDDTTSTDGDEVTNEVEITGLMYSGNPFIVKLLDKVDRTAYFD